MTKIITTNINLEDEIRTIKALEAKLEELKELKEEKEAEIKKLLDNAGLEELQVGAFTIRFTNVVRNNFNTSAFHNYSKLSNKHFLLCIFSYSPLPLPLLGISQKSQLRRINK